MVNQGRELSNAENFDKIILAYSSAGLGFSLAFLKDITPIGKATAAWTLYLSWVLFTVAMILTVASYVLSQLGLKQQLQRAKEYYIDEDDSAFEKKNVLASWTERTNFSSGICFIIAVVLTTAFVSMNMNGATNMTDVKKVLPLGEMKKGAPVPELQKVPPSQPIQPASSVQPASPAPPAPQVPSNNPSKAP
jgi:hypothetical protein